MLPWSLFTGDPNQVVHSRRAAGLQTKQLLSSHISSLKSVPYCFHLTWYPRGSAERLPLDLGWLHLTLKLASVLSENVSRPGGLVLVETGITLVWIKVPWL